MKLSKIARDNRNWPTLITSPHSATVDSDRREEQLFLRVASAVLERTKSPLNAREIVDRAIERGLFGDHVLGRTPQKSMQARLSTSIIEKGSASPIVRVARGQFALRKRLGTLATPNMPLLSQSGSMLKEYTANPRSLRFPEEDVLCVPIDHFEDVLTFQGIDPDHSSVISNILKQTVYVPRAEAESRDDAKQFVTYVIVQCGRRLLSFRRSYLSRAAEFLRGARCIGFGGHVSSADRDIFSGSDLGIEASARRELAEELSIADRNLGAESAAHIFRNSPMERLGVLNDDSSEVGRRHVAIVYRMWIDDWNKGEKLQKGEASVRSLEWIDLTTNGIDLSQFEYWSQLCLRRFYPSSCFSYPVVRHLDKSILQKAQLIVVSGRIGSGKSVTSRFLAHKIGAAHISSGNVLQSLLKCPPISEIGRKEFQNRAEAFIRQDNSPRELASALLNEAGRHKNSKIVIDGVRQIETYKSLQGQCSSGTALLYVNTPPDVAYEMYRAREAANELSFSYRDFLEVYDAPVESDIPALGRIADSYVFNSVGIEQLRRALLSLSDLLN